MMRRGVTTLAPAVVAALLLAGCGSDASTQSEATSAPTGEAATAPSPTTDAWSATPATESPEAPQTTALPSTPSSPATSEGGPSEPAPQAAAAASPAPGAHDVPSRGGVRLPPTGTGRLTDRTVVVDPGHNGRYVARVAERQVEAGHGRTKPCNTSGTANRSMSEHALTWSVATRLVDRLRAQGATVWLTRPDDEGFGPCVDERAAIGNRAGADLVVSVHADGNAGRTARGFHVITAPSMKGGPESAAQSEAFAVRVADGMRNAGMPRSTYLGDRRGIDVRTDIAGLSLSQPPAVMLEMGNMQHPEDAALFARDDFRTSVANGLTDAVTGFLGGEH